MLYIALIWDATNSDQTSAAHRLKCRIAERRKDWQTILALPVLFVRVDASAYDVDRIYRLPNSNGAVLGRLFSREYVENEECSRHPPQAVWIDGDTSRKIVSDHGNTLKDLFWGRY